MPPGADGSIPPFAAGAEHGISVLDHGAKGDGVTSDRAAIQAALDAAVERQRSVYFPVGTYVVDGTLYVRDGKDAAVERRGWRRERVQEDRHLCRLCLKMQTCC